MTTLIVLGAAASYTIVGILHLIVWDVIYRCYSATKSAYWSPPPPAIGIMAWPFTMFVGIGAIVFYVINEITTFDFLYAPGNYILAQRQKKEQLLLQQSEEKVAHLVSDNYRDQSRCSNCDYKFE